MSRQVFRSEPGNVVSQAGNPQDGVKPLAGTICFELRKASGAVMAAMTSEFGRWNLKPSEATLLSYIGANPGCTQSMIATAFRSKPANLVPLIARLEREGIVTRTPGPGRAITIALSEPGEDMLRNVEAGFDRLESVMGRELEAHQKQHLVDALQLVCKAACHYEAGEVPGRLTDRRS
ncbi:MarR family transcriptional regulator [Novosphingobium sp.]|uniref:MarR family winged helix-turn-helix transcriptional regulator n=1 Tax=Novosphingobium sp. TaxID=1874826 RepID=UPI002614A3FE|nr:MarR family transcriptional regulator [Novosphingobium sp.]